MENLAGKTTKHGKKRVTKRVTHSKKIAEKISKKALLYGLPREEATGKLREYIDKGYYDHGQNGISIIFNCKLYVYSEDKKLLITCHGIPGRLSRVAIDQQKKYQERLGI